VPHLENNNHNNDDWDEFDWEKALRDGDDYATHYFQLLKRFFDLPGSDELIMQRLQRDFKNRPSDCNLDCDDCDKRWDCDMALPPEWLTALGNEDFDDDDEFDDDDQDDNRPLEPGDSLFYETHPAFTMLRQTAIGWCNIYAVILPPESRNVGLCVLFHIGRSLANLAYSIGDGLYEQPAASTALAKRCLAQLNQALGGLNQLIQDKPRLRALLSAIQKHLLNSHEAIIDHLHSCNARQRQQNNDSADDDDDDT